MARGHIVFTFSLDLVTRVMCKLLRPFAEGKEIAEDSVLPLSLSHLIQFSTSIAQLH